MATQRNNKAALSEDFYEIFKKIQTLSKKEQRKLVQLLAGPLGMATIPIGQIASQAVTTVQQVGSKQVSSAEERKKVKPPQKKEVNQTPEKRELDMAIHAITEFKTKNGLEKSAILDPIKDERVAPLLERREVALTAFKAVKAADSGRSPGTPKSKT